MLLSTHMTENQQNPTLILGPTSTGQVLYFFSARHGNDPADVQFGQLRQLWEKFLSSAKNDRLVFTESAVREVPAGYEDAIKQRGEVGATQWLAKEVGVTAVCPEPDDIEQRKSLCADFSPQAVAYALIAQNLAAWFRHTHDFTFPEAIERSIKRETKFSDIYGFTPDVAWFQDQHRKLFGEQALEDKAFLDSISDPRKSSTLVNQIVAGRTKMRNEYVRERISGAWKLGKSIFMVYGKGHLAMLESELKKLI